MIVVDLGPLCGDSGNFVTEHGPPTEFEFDIESFSQNSDAIAGCLKRPPSWLGPLGAEGGIRETSFR